LLILLLIKPVLDLFYSYYFFIGPFRLSPTTVTAVFVIFYFVPFRLKYAQLVAPFAGVFGAFVALNLAGVAFGMATDPEARPASALDINIRLVGNYLVFFCAYAAARRHHYTDARPFLKAFVIGTGIAVIINLLAINLGYGGTKVGVEQVSGPYREVGLYFDSGVLGAVAFFNLTSTVVYFHFAKSGKSLLLVLTIALVLIDLYLMVISGSRAPIVQLVVAALFYLWYLRGWGRIAAPIVAALILLAAGGLFLDEGNPAFERLQGDIAALESEDLDIGQTMGGDVSLGKYESLGSNRGMLWANALTAISRQSGAEIIFGRYFSRIRAHSDYIDTLARTGIVGLGLYLLLIYGLALRTMAMARSATRDDDRAIKILACLLLTNYALYAFPFRPMLDTTTGWFTWTIVALALAASPRISRRALPAVANSAGDPAGIKSSGPAPGLTPVAGKSR
jgi:hypothetical protein